MVEEQKARAWILAAVSPLSTTHVALPDSLDRFAAEDVAATVPLPSFDNSVMDGYAVIAASATPGARLKIINEQPAGVSRNLRVLAGEAIRIFTGAPMPSGADAVVMQEDTEREGDSVTIQAEQVSAGEFVRKAGGDLAVGQQILRRGERINPAILGLLASQGLGTVEVCRRASVAIVTTGDEIVPPSQPLRPGQIFESNGVMLSALTKRTGAQVTMCAHARDDFAELCALLGEAAKTDALVISGGVSVGERDLVRGALREIGASLDLWRVKIKPGKPFLFGKCGDCAVFGLPGNPVSSFITFLVLVRPALLRMMGAGQAELDLRRSDARLAYDVTGDETRPHYFRGRLEDGRFTAVGRQESHALYGLARANALLRVAPGDTLPAGTEVAVSLID
jgi:molybdopterin molybdotransferase